MNFSLLLECTEFASVNQVTCNNLAFNSITGFVVFFLRSFFMPYFTR
jgi:hypothetical protein